MEFIKTVETTLGDIAHINTKWSEIWVDAFATDNHSALHKILAMCESVDEGYDNDEYLAPNGWTVYVDWMGADI